MVQYGPEPDCVDTSMTQPRGRPRSPPDGDFSLPPTRAFDLSKIFSPCPWGLGFRPADGPRAWLAEMVKHWGVDELPREAIRAPVTMILLTEGWPGAMAVVAHAVKPGPTHLPLAGQPDSR